MSRRRLSASSESSWRTLLRISIPSAVSPARSINSTASSESDAAETPCTGPSWRSRAMRLRSASIAAFVRRSNRVRSSSRSWRNLNSERMVWSATRAAVTSRTSSNRRGGVPRISEMRAST